MIAGGNHTSIYEDSVPYEVSKRRAKLKFETLERAKLRPGETPGRNRSYHIPEGYAVNADHTFLPLPMTVMTSSAAQPARARLAMTQTTMTKVFSFSSWASC